MRLRSFLLLLLCMCLAASLAGQNEQWLRFTNDAGNFSVLMPGQPTETKNQTPEGESRTFLSISNEVGYTVVYIASPSDQTVDEATFNVYRVPS